MEINAYSYNLGVESFKKNDYQKAIEYMTKAIDENPLIEFTLAYKVRGYSYTNLRKYQLGINDLIEVEKYIKDDSNVYLSLGICYKGLNQIDKAEDCFLECTYKNFHDVKANTNLFKIYKETDDLANAIMFLDRVINVTPSSNLFVEKGRLLDKMQVNPLALNAYSNAIKLNPYDFQGYQGVALIHYRMKEYAKAINYFNKCIELLDVSNFYYFRGICKKNIGDYVGYVEDITIGAEKGNKDALSELSSIPEHLKTENKYILFFDTETTGLPENWNAPVTNVKNWPRIVQISWILYDKNGNYIEKKNYIIRPKDFTIPYESSLLHKITNERALLEGTDIELILQRFEKDLEKSELIIAHNINYDEKVLGAEFIRKFNKNPLNGINKFCTMERTKNICKIEGNYGYKWPKLQELHQHLFSEDFLESHNSDADVTATAKCYWEMKKRKLI